MNSIIADYIPQPRCPKCVLPDCLSRNDPPPVTGLIFNGPAVIGPGACRVRYCSGGKDLEQREPHPLAPLLRMLNTNLALDTEIVSLNSCAGVTEDHLHVCCLNCGYEWLMKTADAETTKVN